MKRKLLGVLLALSLVLSVLPATALAAYSDTDRHWAEEAIDRWSNMGIIQGYDGQFHPDNPITRADMAVILDRLMQNQTATDNTYPDLPPDAYYTTAVLRAREAGVMFGDGTYMRPLDKITREEAVVMVGRALEIQESGTVPGYSDYGAISSWAQGTVNTMTIAGIVHGYDGAFHPKSNMTRAEVVTVLDNIFFGLFAYVKTAGELRDALASDVSFIIVIGQLNGAEGDKTDKVFEIGRPVAILGTSNALVNGNFIVKSDGVTIDSLRIDSQCGSNLSRSAIDVLARQVTITNNTFVLEKSPLIGESDRRGITLWPYGDAQTYYDISGNTFQLHEYENAFCAAIEVVERKDLSAFGFAGEVSGEAHIARGDETALAQRNTYDGGCNYGYVRTDWSTGSPIVQYSYVLSPATERLLSPSTKTEYKIIGSDKNVLIAPTVLSPPAWLLQRAGYLSEFRLR